MAWKKKKKEKERPWQAAVIKLFMVADDDNRAPVVYKEASKER